MAKSMCNSYHLQQPGNPTSRDNFKSITMKLAATPHVCVPFSRHAHLQMGTSFEQTKTGIIGWISKLLTFLVFLSIPVSVYSQQNIDVITQGLYRGIQSPNSASLGNVAEIPVNLYTGKANIAIPLFVDPNSEFNYQISLSYNTGGNKVEEPASWVGLGWALNFGGVITRRVKGLPDDSPQGYYDSASDLVSAWSSLNTTSVFESYDPAQLPSYLTNVTGGQSDPEADQFFYNFNGISGQFYIDESGVATSQPNNNLAIDLYQSGDGIGEGETKCYAYNTMYLTKCFYKIVITTDGGIKYTFEDKEYSGPKASGQPGIPEYVSAWYLTKIESASGSNEITFTYSDPIELERISYHHEQAFTYIQNIVDNPGYWVPEEISNIYRSNFVKYPTSISTPSHNIVLERSNRTAGLAPASKKLDRLIIKNKQDEEVKRWTFSHSYSTNRLTLNSLQALYSGGLQATPPYKFTYNSTALPTNVFLQDHWGYYTDNSDGTSLLPTTAVYIPDEFQYSDEGAGSRDPNPSLTKAGILEQIEYPLGGTVALEYENNEYSKISNFTESIYAEQTASVYNLNSTNDEKDFDVNSSIERLKIHVSIDCSNGTCTPSTSSWFFRIVDKATGSTIFNQIGFYSVASDPRYCNVKDPDLDLIYEVSCDIALPNGSYTAITNEEWVNAPVTVQISHYKKLQVDKLTGSGLRVSKITYDNRSNGVNNVIKYKYTLDSDPTLSSGVLVQQPRYAYYSSILSGGDPIRIVFSHSGYSVNGLGSSSDSYIGYKEVHMEYGINGEFGSTSYYFTTPDEYPNEVPEQSLSPITTVMAPDWKRGLEKEKRSKNETGSIEATEINQYKILNHGDPGSTGFTKSVRGFNLQAIDRPVAGNSNTYYVYKTYEMNMGALFPEKKTVQVYNGNLSNPVETVTDYFFEDPIHLLMTKMVETNSLTGEKRTTTYEYAHEQDGSSGSPDYSAMAGLNMLSQPYSVLIEDGAGIDINKSWIEWDNQSSGATGIWLPDQHWQWSGIGVAPADPSSANSVQVSDVIKYDSYGNVLEIEDASETRTSYDWSNDGVHPIGIYQNASESEIFAHSFAYDGIGDWTIYNLDGNDTEFSVESNKLKVKNFGTAQNGEQDRIYYNLGQEISGVVAIEFDMEIANSVHRDIYFAVGGNEWSSTQGGHSENLIWAFIRNEEWKAYYDNAFNSIKPGLTVGDTYNFKFVINTSTDKVDYYVNGILEVEGANFRLPSTGVQYIAFGNYGYGSATTSWFIDNVRIYPADALAQSQEVDKTLGKTVAVKDASGSTNRFSYDSYNRLKEIFNPLGEKITSYDYYYSLDTNPSYNANEPNKVETVTYTNPTNPSITIKNQSYLDGLGREIQTQQRGANTVISIETLYNERGLPDVVSRPIESTTTAFPGYYTSGLLSGGGTFTPGQAIPSAAPVHTYYDPLLAEANEEDYAYSQNEYETSPLARIKKTTLPGSSHKIGSGKEVETRYGLNTSETFSINGTTWIANSLSKTVSEDPNGKETITYADGWGRTIASGVNMNPTVDDALDDAADLITLFEYDERGNLVRVEDPRGLATTYTYNTLGQLTEKKLPDQEHPVKYKYDDAGQLRFTQDPNQQSAKQDISHSISSSVSVTKTIVANNDGTLELEFCVADLFLDDYTLTIKRVETNTTIYQNTFSPEGDCVSLPNNPLTFTVTSGTYTLTGQAADPGEPIISAYGTYGFVSNDIFTYTKYDGLGRPTEVGEYSGGTTFAAADPDTDTFPTTGNTANLNYYYDDDQTYSGSLTQKNLTGRLAKASFRDLSVSTSSWGHTWYSYNALGLVEWVVQDLPGLSAKTVEYTYDGLSRLILLEYQKGVSGEDFRQRYSYDELGRLYKVESSTNGTSWTEETEYLQFAADGQPIQQTLGNSTIQTVDYTYTVQGWLEKINDPTSIGADKFAMKLVYAYNGNILRQEWRQPQIDTSIQSYIYSYDGANRLTFARNGDEGYCTGFPCSFDVSYTYDKSGNISFIRRHTDAFGYDFSTYSAMNYDQYSMSVSTTSNQLNSLSHFEDINGSGTDHGIKAFGYDASGNITKNDLQGFTSVDYDWRNLPAQLIAGANTMQYAYDADGNRVRKELTSGVETHYVRGANGETLAIYEDDVLQFHNILAGATPIGTWDGSQRRYFLKDHLGSVRATVDQSGNVDGYDDYYPFGLVMPDRSSNQANSTDIYKFTGYENDDEAGLTVYHAGNRIYDAILGRFMQIDRFYDKYPSLSTYQYAANNPINFIDVNGDSIWINQGQDNYLYVDGTLYNKDGSEYTGKVRGFLKQTVNALNKIDNTAEGAGIISELQNSENNFRIVKGEKGKDRFVPSDLSGAYAHALYDAGQGRPDFSGSGGTIYWYPSGSPVSTLDGIRSDATTVLGHELFHGYDSNRGQLDNRLIGGLDRSEWRATYFENSLRSSFNLPLRDVYNKRSGPVRILNANNAPIYVLPPMVRTIKQN